jgi:transposase
MRDTTLYQHLLGIEHPWRVSKVELDTEKQRVDVWVAWYFWATHSRLEPVKKAPKTFKDHLYGILNHARHPISNGMLEGINSKIETMWKAACGFRSKKRFRTAILFRFGGLELFPATHT